MFSTTFRYGLIALVELAEATSCIQASSLASRYNLSRNYMATVLGELRRLGWVSSQKGNRGGYNLVVNPSELSILQIYQGLNGSGVMPWPATESGPQAQMSPADHWLASTAERWDHDLASTSLQVLLDSRKSQKEQPKTTPRPGNPAGSSTHAPDQSIMASRSQTPIIKNTLKQSGT